MGYTHYIRTDKARISKTAFKKITADVKLIESHLDTAGIITLHDGLGEEKGVVYGDNYLAFNGKDDEGYETFYISISDDEDTYNFCKTARKGYDIAVCMTMLSVARHSAKKVVLKTDGTNNDWADAVKRFNMLFGTKVVINIKNGFITTSF